MRFAISAQEQVAVLWIEARRSWKSGRCLDSGLAKMQPSRNDGINSVTLYFGHL
jgi:hypothetical protein